MDLTNKTNTELWELLEKNKRNTTKWNKEYMKVNRYDIHKEIIRREKDDR